MNKPAHYDVLIVGSGASGVNVAYPLVEAGLSVAIVDFGNTDKTNVEIPNQPFVSLRREDSTQHNYFLGKNFEGISLGKLKPGAQFTPSRKFIVEDTDRLVPVHSDTIVSFSTLAQGGLASGWGAGTYSYNENDLRKFPISHADLAPHYEIVAKRIGVSGENDDLSKFDGVLENLLPPLDLDTNSTLLLKKYTLRKNRFNKNGFFMGKTRLAALSQHYRDRGPDTYNDMSFWSDSDKSVWRPQYTLNELMSHKNFSYIPDVLVDRFDEKNDVVILSGSDRSGKPIIIEAGKLVLTSGVLGTARIVLRSMNAYGVKIPFVANPYTYYPMIHIPKLGSSIDERALSLAGVCISYVPTEPGAQPIHGRVHSYRSLLNFKIIKEMPLPFREGIKIMRSLLSAFMVVALDHEDFPSPEKYCILHKGQNGQTDRLEIQYSMTRELRKKQIAIEKKVIRHFLALGCVAIKRVWPGYGASLHYGGTFPMSMESKPLTVNTFGLLNGTSSIYIADGSIFPYLAAKGLTFTMMANANRIGTHLALKMSQN